MTWTDVVRRIRREVIGKDVKGHGERRKEREGSVAEAEKERDRRGKKPR